MNNWMILGIAYLLGTFPASLIVVKLFTEQDVRASGSGNAGGFNTWRLVSHQRGGQIGLMAFIIVAAADVAKAMIAVRWLPVESAAGLTLAAAGVILGHNYPFYLKFYGGRGAACLIGAMLAVNWRAAPVWLLTVMAASVVTDLISRRPKLSGVNTKFIYRALSEQIAGRLIGEVIAVLPVYLLEPKLLWPVAAGTALIIWRHKERLEKQLRTRSN